MSPRYLWITRLLPYPPFRGGDALYSSGLIQALAGAGTSVTVVTRASAEAAPPPLPGVEWVLERASDPRSRVGSLLSLSPSIVYRSSPPALMATIGRALCGASWDAVIVDHLASAGAMRVIRAARARIPIAYVAHNHETSLRWALASDFRWYSPMRAALSLDVIKAARLERDLIRRSSLITAISPADAQRFRRDAKPPTEVVNLPPGYSGEHAPPRTITHRTPRRVLLLGSYEWIAKQRNLHAFLRDAAPTLFRAGVGIDVVGAMPGKLAVQLAVQYPGVHFAGSVDNISDHMRNARIGVVADAVGGGFKLKALDYVFQRVPIASLRGLTSGMPLVDGRSILEFDSAGALAAGVSSVIDRTDLLNEIADAAYRACNGRFRWEDRGQDLAAALTRIQDRPLGQAIR